jgi:hypothetical protein
MEEIYDTNDSFDFSKLVLTKPISINSGNYFIRLLMENRYLYIQPPKSTTKQGILKSGKKYYTDLIYTNENENFIRWMENLENHCQKCIFEKRKEWFDGEMELHDIENYFTPLLKVYKSGKYYSIRININSVLNKPNIKIYDEDENEVDVETIDDKINIMTILEIKGIKCSAKSFQIEVEMKQMMTLKPVMIFEKCLLKTKKKEVSDSNENMKNMEIKEDFELRGTENDTILPSIENKDIMIEDEKTETDLQIYDENEATHQDESIELLVDYNKVEKEIEEIQFPLDEIKDEDVFRIKDKSHVYYQMYREARKKAKIARQFALSSYLEAKEIKNKYMLDDIKDSDDEDDDDYDDDYDEKDYKEDDDYENLEEK